MKTKTHTAFKRKSHRQSSRLYFSLDWCTHRHRSVLNYGKNRFNLFIHTLHSHTHTREINCSGVANRFKIHAFKLIYDAFVVLLYACFCLVHIISKKPSEAAQKNMLRKFFLVQHLYLACLLMPARQHSIFFLLQIHVHFFGITVFNLTHLYVAREQDAFTYQKRPWFFPSHWFNNDILCAMACGYYQN